MNRKWGRSESGLGGGRWGKKEGGGGGLGDKVTYLIRRQSGVTKHNNSIRQITKAN